MKLKIAYISTKFNKTIYKIISENYA